MSMTFRHQATTEATPDQVWERLQNPATWAAVAGADSTSDHTYRGDELTWFRFTATVGGVPYRGTARVTEATPDEMMTLSIRSNELQGIIVVEMTLTNPGTRLDVSMMMRPSGLLGPMVFPVVSRAVATGFPDSVERLAAAMV